MVFIVNYKDKNEVEVFNTIDELSEYLGNIWKEKINSLRTNEFYSIALSGGNTPIKIFKYLSLNFKDAIKWNRIKFFWGDERCVPPSDSDSNYKLAKDYLFDNIKMSKQNIFRIKGELDPNLEVINYSNILKSKLKLVDGIPQLDFILLGLGEDGHTASIFPNQIELFNSSNFCEVAEHPESGQKRITITGSIINNANNVAIVAVGKSKSNRVKEILNKYQIAKSYPAMLVKPLNNKLFWALDKESAKNIHDF